MYSDEADALREDRLVETLKTAVNGSKEPKEKALSLAVAQIERSFRLGRFRSMPRSVWAASRGGA